MFQTPSPDTPIIRQQAPTFNLFNDPGEITGATTNFLNTNTLVAKIAFLFLVVILFIVALRIGTQIISWALTPSGSPMLVNGMKDARKPLTIEQNPRSKNSIPIMRSDNEKYGIEFTYSVWLFIDSLPQDNVKYMHVFHKGNDFVNTDEQNLIKPNNAPGVYIDKQEVNGVIRNDLIIFMNTFKHANEKVRIKNIPLNKWISLVIRCNGSNLDVYINGTIALRHTYSSVPKQNYGNLYVNLNGGFNGFLSNLQYHNRSLSIREIIRINDQGPNLKMNTEEMKVNPPYFSLRWYLGQ